MVDQPQKDGGEAISRVTNKGKGTGKKLAKSEASSPPCGACKYMRRKCRIQCVFAPYFASSDQGLAMFAIVHKVFGANNVSKMLLNVAPEYRHEVVVSLLYEAQARLADPIHGYLSTIFAFQQQVASLQGELLIRQNQLINATISYATLLQSTQQQQQANINVAVQPAYSNNSTNLTSFFNPGFDHLTMQTTSSSHNLESFQFSALPQNKEENKIKPQVFNNDMAHHIP